uniref:DAGKc domain-containing protein n=1 Tax=Globodera rostochiensis TaxID=31243 RepID=A0A914HKP6_GLORO
MSSPSFSGHLTPTENGPNCWRPHSSFSPPIPFKWPPSGDDYSGLFALGNSFRLHLDDIISIHTVSQPPSADETPRPSSEQYLLLTVCPFTGPFQRQLRRFELRPEDSSQLAPLKDSLWEWLHQRRLAVNAPHNPIAVHSHHVLVLLNPFSGQRRALDLWKAEVEPLWREAGISYEFKLTEGPDHAVRLASELDLDRISVLALGGGDGVMSEAINGLFLRSDRHRALRLPLLHLPMGTGNSLAASLAFMANEPFPPRGTFCRQMALMALRPCYRRLRLYHAEFSRKRTKIMFLSLSWGLLADIDLGSERFRFLGLIRLHVEAFLRIAQLPSVARYRARLSYLPVSAGEARLELERKLRFGVEKPRKMYGDGHFKGGEVEGMEGQDDGDGVEEFAFNEAEMPTLEEPIPSNWISIEGEFCFVLLSTLSHLGSDIPILPSARPQDPVLYLSFVRWKNLRSRVHMANILLNINSSAHLDDPAFEIIPVMACRIQPAPGMGGFVALDGEPIQNEKGQAFQVVTTRWNATVVGRREA